MPGFSDFVAVMDVFDHLLEADGDEKPKDDGGDVNEEVAPGVGGMVGRVDIKYGGGFLG